MMLKICIDDPHLSYSPGQTILGRIKYPVENPHFVEVNMKLVGEEFTNYTIFHRGWRSNFLETKNVVIKSGELNAGNHEFPFKVTLPKHIPSSYSGRYGYVAFYLRAYLDKQDKARYEDELEFNVFSPIDLNDLENLWLAPNTHSDEIVIDRWCCVREEISMEVKLQRKAFVVGDNVNVVVVLLNSTHLTVSEVKLKLFVRTQAKVATPRQEFLSVDEILTSDEGRSSGCYREKFYAFQLHIPPDAVVPNFEKCSLFSQTATLEVVAVLADTTKPNLKVEVGLVLGHIPIDGYDMFYNPTEPTSNSTRGKAFLPDPAVIRPLSYGFPSDIALDQTKLLPNNQPNNLQVPISSPSSNGTASTKRSYDNKTSPESPSMSSSKQSLQDIPYNSISSSNTSDDIPLTIRIYENCFYMGESPKKVHDLKKNQVPCPKLTTVQRCPYPTTQHSLPIQMPMPPPSADASSAYKLRMPMPSHLKHQPYPADITDCSDLLKPDCFSDTASNTDVTSTKIHPPGFKLPLKVSNDHESRVSSNQTSLPAYSTYQSTQVCSLEGGFRKTNDDNSARLALKDKSPSHTESQWKESSLPTKMPMPYPLDVLEDQDIPKPSTDAASLDGRCTSRPIEFQPSAPPMYDIPSPPSDELELGGHVSSLSAPPIYEEELSL